MTPKELTIVVFYGICLMFFILPLFSRNKVVEPYGRIPKRRIWLDWSIVIPCIVYALLVGYRYNYGFDWRQYYYTFQFIQRGALFRETTETGYLVINKVIGLLGGDIYTLFIFEGFMWVFSLCYLFRNHRRQIHVVLPLFIMMTWFRVLNLSRQHFGMSFFFIAIACIIEGKKLWYFFWSAIAISIHTSVLVYVIPFFLIKKLPSYLPSKKTLLLVYSFIFLGKTIFISILLKLGTFVSSWVITNKNYDALSLMQNRFQWTVALSKMLSMSFFDVTAIIAFWYIINFLKAKYQENNVLNVFHSVRFKNTKDLFVYYMAYLGLLGAFLRPIGEAHEIFSRTFLYFTYFETLGFSFWVYFLFKNMKSLRIPLWLKLMTFMALLYRIYSAFFSLISQIDSGCFIEYR